MIETLLVFASAELLAVTDANGTDEGGTQQATNVQAGDTDNTTTEPFDEPIQG